MWVEIKGRGRITSTITAIEPGERRELWVFKDSRWEDVTTVWVKTLAGSTIRAWGCDRREDRHVFEGRYSCTIHETWEDAPLNDVENASLWVYVVNREPDEYSTDRHIELHVRAGSEVVGSSVCAGPVRR